MYVISDASLAEYLGTKCHIYSRREEGWAVAALHDARPRVNRRGLIGPVEERVERKPAAGNDFFRRVYNKFWILGGHGDVADNKRSNEHLGDAHHIDACDAVVGGEVIALDGGRDRSEVASYRIEAFGSWSEKLEGIRSGTDADRDLGRGLKADR